MSVVVVACSDTESVIISVVIKKGFAALRYLNDGKLTKLEDIITIPAIIVPPKSARQLRIWDLLLIFLITTHAIRNAVEPIRKKPFRLEKNVSPVLSNNELTRMNVDTKITDVQTMNLLSFFRNGSARKKIPMGNMKNWIPPHEARPNPSKIPAPTIFATETFPLSDFIALRSR